MADLKGLVSMRLMPDSARSTSSRSHLRREAQAQVILWSTQFGNMRFEYLISRLMFRFDLFFTNTVFTYKTHPTLARVSPTIVRSSVIKQSTATRKGTVNKWFCVADWLGKAERLNTAGWLMQQSSWKRRMGDKAEELMKQESGW